jgi:hypothetical protein
MYRFVCVAVRSKNGGKLLIADRSWSGLRGGYNVEAHRFLAEKSFVLQVTLFSVGTP